MSRIYILGAAPKWELESSGFMPVWMEVFKLQVLSEALFLGQRLPGPPSHMLQGHASDQSVYKN